MAEHRTVERSLEARLKALDTLRVMFAVFREMQDDMSASDALRAQLDVDMQVHQLMYDSQHSKFIGIPDGMSGTDEVDALQLLELMDLAERYDVSIEVEGILVTSFIPATFIVDPYGRVEVLLANGSDTDAAWVILEMEYEIIGMMELGLE